MEYTDGKEETREYKDGVRQGKCLEGACGDGEGLIMYSDESIYYGMFVSGKRHGQGMWSTMYAFISLQADGRTVNAISFYQHGETPGLGAEIANPQWQQRWINKQIFDLKGDVRLRVIHGAVDKNSKNAPYEIDGISGATLTGNGVTNMIRYWFGDQGFGPYLAKLQQGS